MESNKTVKPKKIIYKSLKEIPIDNPNKEQCNKFISTKMRFCKFERMKDSEFCNHHNLDKGSLCINCGHFIFSENLTKHGFNCKAIKEQEVLETQPWYSKNINLLREVNAEETKNINMSEFIKKVYNTYEKLKEEYSEYLNTNMPNLTRKGIDMFINEYLVSGININDNDLNQTLQLARLEKHSTQGDSLIALMKIFNLIEDIDIKENKRERVYIEFGAGKGGLSEKVIEATKDKEKYVLLERSGVRYKKDKCSNNCSRYKTDILNFDLNYIISKEKTQELIGIAKHICGCALDMSITSLINVIDNFKGICFASCCHHLGNINNFLGYNKLKNSFKFEDAEINLLFKITSWLFEDEKIELSEKYSDCFKTHKEKKKIGLIGKYIIDLSRCLYLISKGKNVAYVKYCSNTYTTENNAIVCF